jgi:chromate transporter
MKQDVLLTVLVQFAILSFLAFGGINTTIPEMHRQVVELRPLMDDRTFTELFAIAQAAPGPNFLIATLIGLTVAGMPGAVVATLAICAPSCLITFATVTALRRYADTPWLIAIRAGLVPVTVGLIASSAFILAQSTSRTWLGLLVTLGTAALVYLTRIHPLWAMLAAGALGAAGLV